MKFRRCCLSCVTPDPISACFFLAPPAIPPPQFLGAVSDSILKVRLHKASEQYGPISHYIVCVIPEDTADRNPDEYFLNIEVLFPSLHQSSDDNLTCVPLSPEGRQLGGGLGGRSLRPRLPWHFTLGGGHSYQLLLQSTPRKGKTISGLRQSLRTWQCKHDSVYPLFNRVKHGSSFPSAEIQVIAIFHGDVDRHDSIGDCHPWQEPGDGPVMDCGTRVWGSRTHTTSSAHHHLRQVSVLCPCELAGFNFLSPFSVSSVVFLVPNGI